MKGQGTRTGETNKKKEFIPKTSLEVDLNAENH